MPLRLYPFRFRDPVTGKWLRARYKATREDIAARYAVWEIAGPPEIRDSSGDTYFNPLRTKQAILNKYDGVERQPQLSEGERALVLLFLRRYVTYCARKRRWNRMQNAGRLYRWVELSA